MTKKNNLKKYSRPLGQCRLFTQRHNWISQTLSQSSQPLKSKGVNEGQRADLTGGGLIRSSGGWAALKEFRKAGIRVKGDERILGDSDFVSEVLKVANEQLEEKYGLRAAGYGFDRIVYRVAQVLSMEPNEVVALDKSPLTVRARALLCFWAHRKLGMTTIEISEKLSVGQPAVSRLSRRGKRIASEELLSLAE
jgi:putative transposase